MQKIHHLADVCHFYKEKTMTDSTNPSAIRSQNEITEALLTLMRKYPYKEITVKQIILEARLAKKTFYRNFTSKEDVLRSLIKRRLGEYFDVVNNAHEDILKAEFRYLEKNKELLMLLDQNGMSYIILQCTNEYLPSIRSERLSQSNPSIPLFEGLDKDYLMAFNIGAILNVAALWVHRGMTDDPDKISKLLAEYFERIKTFM